MQLEVILEEKSHSHPCLVKQRQLTSQSRRKRKAEIVSVSVSSCPQIWNIQLEKDREKVSRRRKIFMLEKQRENFVVAVRK